eukprot:scaffold323_cov414-Prasinococcus_capsulatus_cf.AAC.51
MAILGIFGPRIGSTDFLKSFLGDPSRHHSLLPPACDGWSRLTARCGTTVTPRRGRGVPCEEARRVPFARLRARPPWVGGRGARDPPLGAGIRQAVDSPATHWGRSDSLGASQLLLERYISFFAPVRCVWVCRGQCQLACVLTVAACSNTASQQEARVRLNMCIKDMDAPLLAPEEDCEGGV